MREIPLVNHRILLFFVLIATVIATTLEHNFGYHLDNWIHDSAIVYQARQQWDYGAIVVLDNNIPMSVDRKQALPLFARAADQLIKAGAKGIYFDARVSKKPTSQMPYARCITQNNQVQWSKPSCIANEAQQCILGNSPLGLAPLAMSIDTLQHFSIAPYLDIKQGFPDFLLYGWEASLKFSPENIVASDRLLTKNDAIARWIDLSDDHAIVRLARFVNPGNMEKYLQDPFDETCDKGFRCRRIRLSIPRYTLNMDLKRPVFPLSRLASCDESIAQQTARLLKGRVIVFQATGLTESTDIVITPVMTAIFGPKLLVPGAQYLVDSLETLLKGDHPRPPQGIIKIIIFIFSAFAGIYCAIYLKLGFLIWIGILILLLMTGLCLFNPIVQLWPVTCTIIAFIVGSLEAIAVLLLLEHKEGRLIDKYIPKQIRDILLSQEASQEFCDKHCFAMVLMSDLAGYTTLTQLLKDPELILTLMNDYFNETALVLQKKYNGWLEGYVGDMVCYYWPFQSEPDKNKLLENALLGALELVALQKQFFSTLHHRYQGKISSDILEKINDIIDAGTGLSCGEVIMGNLGPKDGIRKFGILGNPMNIASRVESLTRLFNTEIIVTENCLSTTQNPRWAIRYLGCINIKGGLRPEMLYALGHADDPRFANDVVKQWNQWLKQFISGHTPNTECPSIFELDKQTLMRWKSHHLLGKNGIWYLDEK